MFPRLSLLNLWIRWFLRRSVLTSALPKGESVWNSPSQYICISLTSSLVICLGQVWHLNLTLSLLHILCKAFLLITWPHESNMGVFALVAGSLVTGQINTLWNLRSGPRLISQGNSLVLVVYSSMIFLSLLSFGIAITDALLILRRGDSKLRLLCWQNWFMNTFRTLCFTWESIRWSYTLVLWAS